MVPARSREVLESRIERGPRMQQRGYYPYYIGMIFYSYMAWKCKNLRLSLGQLVEELESIRIALVQEKLGGKVEMVVEEMGAKQAKLFSLLDLGK